MFPSHCFQQNILESFWVLAEIQREEEKNSLETISWSLFLKSSICSSLHLLWLAFLQISQHPMKEESKVYCPSCYVALNYIGNFIAHLLPPISPDCLTILCLQHKRQHRNLRPLFQFQIEHDITHWQRLTIWPCSLKAIRLHSDQDAEKKEKSFCEAKFVKCNLIIHWQVVITISDD